MYACDQFHFALKIMDFENKERFFEKKTLLNLSRERVQIFDVFWKSEAIYYLITKF